MRCSARARDWENAKRGEPRARPNLAVTYPADFSGPLRKVRACSGLFLLGSVDALIRGLFVCIVLSFDLVLVGLRLSHVRVLGCLVLFAVGLGLRIVFLLVGLG